MMERRVEIHGRTFTIWCKTEEQLAERIKLLEEMPEPEPVEEEVVE